MIRTVQEALTNTWWHARTKKAWVRFELEENWAKVTIGDDGRGFDPSEVMEEARARFGLQIMRERAESIGGSLGVDSAPGQGTKVVARLPLEVC